ncbi:cardiolipin synthase [Parafilimonas terrae]|uniref:Cardiolipin synthase n=2 Tax=Parafilimonas terrae TaxID=1465490 RepID=A0A1I5TD61_9BACT|nr:cardiolipin synthase [Parafilimonas terrae]
MHNKVTLVRGGKQYFDLLEHIINRAHTIIHLQMYIFNEDETGNRFINALLKAAGKGVQVFIVLDGYASRNISKACIDSLKSAGIHFRWFNPIFKSRYFYFGRRLHHKVVVADAFTGLVGGVNITNRYNDLDEPAWLDWALHVQGEASFNLNKICADIWDKSMWGRRFRTRFILPEKFFIPNETCMIRARVNDWVRGKKQVSKTYTDMLKQAQYSVTIMSSYFLPGALIKKHLSAAARRGVKIKVIAAGISDVQLAKQAERYIYRWLFKNNIEIYEYKKTVLHGKLSTADKKFVTAGSYNLNNISAYASIELNLDVLDAPFAKKTETILQKIIREDCIQITEAEYDGKVTFFMRAWQRICFDTYRIILYLFTFYFKRRHG